MVLVLFQVVLLSVSVKINNVIGPYIKSYKWVRQDHRMILYPLFCLILWRITSQEWWESQVEWVICGVNDHIIPRGVAIIPG